jgi:hypothetical protein
MTKYQELPFLFPSKKARLSHLKSHLFEHPCLCTGISNKLDSWSLKKVNGLLSKHEDELIRFGQAVTIRLVKVPGIALLKKHDCNRKSHLCLTIHSSALESPTRLILGA